MLRPRHDRLSAAECTRLFAQSVATWFGCGRSLVAPGTVGSLAAVPIHVLLRRAAPAWYWTVWSALALLGIACSQQYATSVGQDDPREVVVDEVVGALLAMGLVRGRSPAAALLSLALFRALDIAKPGPIDRVQRTGPPGFAIMADDLLAGATAGWMAALLTRR
ncbi:MAG: phosphatidylglycerophosphatase A [Polyangiaceae bacterium]|nr:phosphatidylglycerophosphatase A [Polyangiaceae bacterium]